MSDGGTSPNHENLILSPFYNTVILLLSRNKLFKKAHHVRHSDYKVYILKYSIEILQSQCQHLHTGGSSGLSPRASLTRAAVRRYTCTSKGIVGKYATVMPQSRAGCRGCVLNGIAGSVGECRSGGTDVSEPAGSPALSWTGDLPYGDAAKGSGKMEWRISVKKEMKPMMEDEEDDGNTSGDAGNPAPDSLRLFAVMRG